MLVGSQSKFSKFVQKIEFRLILFFVYAAFLLYAWIKIGHIMPVVVVHAIAVLVIGIIYSWEQFLMFLVSPLLLIYWPLQMILTRRYLRQFKQNIPAKTVIVLGHSNWFTLEGWTKPIFSKKEIKWLVKVLKAENRDFSFYPDAGTKEVEKIMADKNVEEVYFMGHGNSHCFQLGTDEILYYCDFNDPKYGKEFVHQVHCGDAHGKSLIDYVVSEKNRPKCFFFRKLINSGDIVREFKKREKAAQTS